MMAFRINVSFSASATTTLFGWCFVILLVFQPKLSVGQTTEECSCGFGGLCINEDENGIPVEPQCNLCQNISAGFYEPDCQNIVNHCDSEPCPEGECVPTFGGYFCECPPHFVGQRCEFTREQLGGQNHRVEVYVYYQVQTGRKGKRTPFYLVFDPGEQEKIMETVESGVKVEISIDDGRVLYPIRRHQFSRLNVKRICEEDAENYPEIFDSRVCRYLPDGEVWTFPFDPQFYTFPETNKLFDFVSIPIGENGENINVGVTGNVKIRILWLTKKAQLVLFDQTYKLFTYLMSKVVHTCFPTVEFDGCSQDRNFPHLQLRKDPIRVTQITDYPASCKGLRVVEHSWSVQRAVGFLGEYDPVPTKLKDAHSLDTIVFPRMYFTNGVHMIERRLDLRGDPPIHGGETASVIYTRCWIQVELGKMDVGVKGGNLRTMPCYSSLELTFQSFNPSYELADMHFIISCDNLYDDDCIPRATEVPAIRKIFTPCELVYNFTVEVIHTISVPETLSFQVAVKFVNSDVVIAVDCSFNCYPVDPSHRMIAVATTEPFITDTLSWMVSTFAGHSITDREPEVEAFFPMSASRILRVDGNSFVNKNATTDFQVLAKSNKFPFAAGIRSRSNNLKMLVNDFKIERISKPNETPTYKFYHKSRDQKQFHGFPIQNESEQTWFEYFPVTFRVVETNTLLRDSLLLVESNYLKDLVFRPEWIRIQLCIEDSSAVEACSKQHIVNETVKNDHTQKEMEKLFLIGDVKEFLHTAAIWLYHSLKKKESSLKWRVGVLVRHIILRYALRLEHVEQTTIQATTHLLSMIFYSEIGNQNENLGKFVEDDVLKNTSFPKLVDWASMRYTGLSVLLKITSWMKEFTEDEVKFTKLIYGDILDGLMRTWSLAHVQGYLVLLGAKKYADNLGFEQWEGYLVKMSKDDTRLLMEVIRTFTQTLAQSSRLFYGIRDLGTKHARAWTMRTTYQGILASFNRSRVGESLPGYSNHVFGPTYPGNEWVALVNITLPDSALVQSLSGRELCFTVFTIGSRPGDFQVSPTLFIDMRDVRGKVYNKLPDDLEYQVTLPIMVDGQLANASKSFFYQSELASPSDARQKFEKYHVYKYTLPSVFERWDLTLHMNNSVPVRVKVSYDGLPLYEEVATQDVLPLQWDKESSQFSGDILLRPKTGQNVLPKTFYLGIMLANPEEVSQPVPFYLTNSVEICRVRDPNLRHIKKFCKGMMKKDKNDNLINCVCDVFGFITAVSKFAQISQVVLRDIDIVLPVESILRAYALPIVLALIIIVTLIIACIADFRRERQDVLIYMSDTYPQDKNVLVIGVYTGKNIISGTVSTVAIKIVGLNSSSRVHLLKSKKQRTLKSTCDDWFVLTTKQPLGKIKSICLWHNYRCLSNWYCNHVLIYDIKQGTWYMANVERWFKLSPIMDESRMAIVQTSKLSTLETGLRALPNKFRNHYIMETRNSHPVVSLFCLHKRSLSSHEQKSLIFLIKCFAMGFWSWFAIEHVNTWIYYNYVLVPDEVEGQFGFNLNTFITCLSMALGAYVFTAPYSMIIKSTYSSRLIQKRTTNPLVLEVVVPEHPVKTITKEKESSRSDSKLKSVMFQLGPADKPAEPETLSKSGDSKLGVKMRKAAHQSPWKKFIRIAFGPCQFRCVNISHQVFGLKMRKRIMIARVLAAIMILVCAALIVRFEKMTHLWTKSNVCIILLILALLLDSFVISPIITLFSSILSFAYLQTSNQEIYMWHEDTKINSPTPLTLDEYISVATGKNYKPLLSEDIEKVEEKTLEYSFLRSLVLNVCIVAVVLVNMILLADRYGAIAYHTTRTLIKAYNEGGLSPLDEISSHNVHLNYVDNVKLPTQVETFVSLNVADLPSRWPNYELISKDGRRWGKDLSSKILGASSLLICFISSKGMKMKIARMFTPFFKQGEGSLSEMGVENERVFLDEKLLKFAELDKIYTMRGVSGEYYNLHGHQAVMPVKDWSRYYVMLDSFLRELIYRREETPTPRVIVLTTNFLNGFTRRVITVDFLAEFLPSGVTTAKLLVNSSVAYSPDHHLVLIMRLVLTILVAVLFIINVMEVSKMGFKNYICELHGFIKVLVFLSGVLVVVSTFQCFFPKYARIDTLFRRTIERHTDIHRVHTWELADSLAICTFVLAICSELTVVVRNAFGANLLKQATTKGFRVVLTACILLIFICRAVEVCFGLKRAQKFIMFFELQFRLSELPKFLYLAGLAQIVTLLILMSMKACTAINIYYFVNTERSVDTTHMKTVRILRRYLPRKKNRPRPSTRRSSARSTTKSESSKKSSASSGDQKIETRSERLWSKVQSLGSIWGTERE